MDMAGEKMVLWKYNCCYNLSGLLHKVLSHPQRQRIIFQNRSSHFIYGILLKIARKFNGGGGIMQLSTSAGKGLNPFDYGLTIEDVELLLEIK